MCSFRSSLLSKKNYYFFFGPQKVIHCIKPLISQQSSLKSAQQYSPRYPKAPNQLKSSKPQNQKQVIYRGNSSYYIFDSKVQFIQLKLLPSLQKRRMNSQAPTDSESGNQVYGFLCQKTNVFYAIDSYESYQQLLRWLQTQPSDTQDSISDTLHPQELSAVNETDQLADYQRATREIMQVFNDPVFQTMQEEIQLQEVDF